MSKGVSLDQRLAFIGFRIAYQADDIPLGSSELFQCDIESTLIDAAYESIHDGRIRSLLFSWLMVHGDRVIVEKLFKHAEKVKPIRGHNPIINGIAVFCTLNGFLRYKKYIQQTPENEYLIDREETESFGRIQGFKDKWLIFGVKVPGKLIRLREEDVLTVQELSQRNLQFRNRLLIGSAWRSDIITAIEWGAETPAEIKRRIGCSYEPAHRVFQEYKLYRLVAVMVPSEAKFKSR